MKFKRSFSVFIDNFSTTYKLLLYKLIVVVIAFAAVFASIYPFVSELLASAQWTALTSSISDFLTNFFNGNVNELANNSTAIQESFGEFAALVVTENGKIILGVVILILIYAVYHFLSGLGDYAAAVLINDKMTLHANSPFINTLVKNFGRACKYNALYVPLSILYDIVVILLSYLLFFEAFSFIPLLFKLFLFVAVIVFAISIKHSFAVGWLPSMIAGNLTCFEAFKFSFNIKAKRLWEFMCDFCLINIIIFALTVSFTLCTFGVATVILVPASSVFILCYKFVYYFSYMDYKYFIDEETIVKPKKEHTPTREEFFKGEQD